MADALQSADVAGLLTVVDIQRLAAAVVAKSTLGELSPPGQACQACPHGQLCHAKAEAARVLDTDGLHEYTHVPVRCRAAGCAARGRYQWANFVSIKKGAHRYSWAREEWPDPFMISPTFGITQSWFQQFSRRLAHQQTSFWGEAEVHWRPGSGMSKKRMHMKLMKAWYLMRLLTRLAEIKGSRSYLRLRLSTPLEDVIKGFWPQLETHLRNLRHRHAEVEGAVCKIVIDGHQKLTRKSCGLMYGGYTHHRDLGKVCLHPCPAPVRGQRERWCAYHAGLLEKPVLFEGARDTGDFVVQRRECLGSTLDDVLYVASQRDGAGAVRVVHDIAGCWDAVQSTLVARAAAAAKEEAVGAPGDVQPKAPVPRLRLRKRKAQAELRPAAPGPSAAAVAAPQASDPAARAESAPPAAAETAENGVSFGEPQRGQRQ